MATWCCQNGACQQQASGGCSAAVGEPGTGSIVTYGATPVPPGVGNTDSKAESGLAGDAVQVTYETRGDKKVVTEIERRSAEMLAHGRGLFER